MWESGSYFDFLLNEIQNDPTSVTPNIMGMMAAVNRTVVQQDRNITLSKTPVLPTLVSSL